MKPRIVVFGALFSNSPQQNAEVFIRERMFQAEKRIPIVVVAPSPSLVPGTVFAASVPVPFQTGHLLLRRNVWSSSVSASLSLYSKYIEIPGRFFL